MNDGLLFSSYASFCLSVAGVSGILCVGRFHQLKNRPPKMMANCIFASTHSLVLPANDLADFNDIFHRELSALPGLAHCISYSVVRTVVGG